MKWWCGSDFGATTEELITLADHGHAVVSGYAFWALAKQNYPDLHIIYNQHKDDTEAVDVLQGCIGGAMPLSGFTTWVVTPRALDMNCKKLY